MNQRSIFSLLLMNTIAVQQSRAWFEEWSHVVFPSTVYFYTVELKIQTRGYFQELSHRRYTDVPKAPNAEQM
jgi:hypothetical protein